MSHLPPSRLQIRSKSFTTQDTNLLKNALADCCMIISNKTITKMHINQMNNMKIDMSAKRSTVKRQSVSQSVSK